MANNSFHYRVDRVNRTYSYGQSYADYFAEWAGYVGGTEYAFEPKRIQQLVNYYLDWICKQCVYGIYVDKGVNELLCSKLTGYPQLTAKTESQQAAGNLPKEIKNQYLNRY